MVQSMLSGMEIPQKIEVTHEPASEPWSMYTKY